MVVKPPGQASVWNQYGTLSGNTAGASTFSGTNIVLQGGPNVTVSATGATIVLSAASGTAAGAWGVTTADNPSRNVVWTDLGVFVAPASTGPGIFFSDWTNGSSGAWLWIKAT